MSVEAIYPQWSCAQGIQGFTTCRSGGFSQTPYTSLNLGDHVQDNAADVAQNRQRLSQHYALPSNPLWLNQVHGAAVQAFDTRFEKAHPSTIRRITADASYTNQVNQVLAILTADCLPIFVATQLGTPYQEIALIHGGWRSLVQDIIKNTLSFFKSEPSQLCAWLGPCIGPEAFEVGQDVYAAALALNPMHYKAFKAIGPQKWYADLAKIAALELNQLGVFEVTSSQLCTYNHADKFYSYRREGQTGRMASLLWLSE